MPFTRTGLDVTGHTRLHALLREADAVLRGIGHLREIAVVLPSDSVPSVASTEFIVLRPKSGSPLSVEALLVYLRSRLPQIVFKWSQDGSNPPRFDERELLNLPLPKVLISDQGTYLSAVREMVAQR